MTEQPADHLLPDITVLERGWSIAARYCGRVLAQLEARVLMVRDTAAAAEPPARTVHLDYGKEPLSAPDIESLWPALKTADILLDGGEPLLDHDTVHARYPRLIILSIPPAEHAGNELLAAALSGSLYLTGSPDRPPTWPDLPLCQQQAGLQAVVAAMAALLQRDIDGKGTLVQVSTIAAAAFAHGALTAHLNEGRSYRRSGPHDLSAEDAAPHLSTILPCQDGFVHVHDAPAEPQSLLAALLDQPALVDAPPGQTTAAALEALCRDWLAPRTRDEAVRAAQALRHPWAPVRSISEVLADKSLWRQGVLRSVSRDDSERPTPQVRTIIFRRPTIASSVMLSPQVKHLGRGGSPPHRSRPLAGVQVVELASAIAGPLVGRLLVALGADVIKIEHPHASSESRGSAFHQYNGGKRSVALDLAQPQGLLLLHRLIRHSDVLLHNLSPRASRNLGLGYGKLAQRHPELILAALPAYGTGGRRRNHTAFGVGIEAASGLAGLIGYPDGPPLRLGGNSIDCAAAMRAAGALLAALRQQLQTGQGMYLELPMLAGVLDLLGEQLVESALSGAPVQRGVLSRTSAPYGVFPCAGDDRWIAIAITDDCAWQQLRMAMGDPAWASHSSYATVGGRLAAAATLEQQLAGWTSQFEAQELTERLQAAGVAATAVLSPAEVANDLYARGRLVTLPASPATTRPLRLPTPGFLLEDLPWSAPPATPLGEHTRAVLGGLLGLPEGELDGLAAAGVIAG